MSLGRAATVLLLLSAFLAAAWMLSPVAAPSPCVVVAGPAQLPDIQETSGLAISRRDNRMLWSHNDSGHETSLFAIDASGATRGRVAVPVSTRDWEDVSVGRCPSGNCVYIADIGDNGGARKVVRIYRVPEPAFSDRTTAQPEVFNAEYADGPHNAEAMFVVGDDLFIVTKDRTGGVYRSHVPQTGAGPLRFERVGELGLRGVTDAEASPDERTVVVRTPEAAYLYNAGDIARGVVARASRIPLDIAREAQGEGAAFDGDVLYLTSEGIGGPGQFVGLRCQASAGEPRDNPPPQ